MSQDWLKLQWEMNIVATCWLKDYITNCSVRLCTLWFIFDFIFYRFIIVYKWSVLICLHFFQIKALTCSGSPLSWNYEKVSKNQNASSNPAHQTLKRWSLKLRNRPEFMRSAVFIYLFLIRKSPFLFFSSLSGL